MFFPLVLALSIFTVTHCGDIDLKDQGNCRVHKVKEVVKYPGCEPKEIEHEVCTGKCKSPGGSGKVIGCSTCKAIKRCYEYVQLKCLFKKKHTATVKKYLGCICMPNVCSAETPVTIVNGKQTEFIEYDVDLKLKVTKKKKCQRKWW